MPHVYWYVRVWTVRSLVLFFFFRLGLRLHLLCFGSVQFGLVWQEIFRARKIAYTNGMLHTTTKIELNYIE